MALELVPEIYIIIASFISSPSTLSSCCRVSKTFRNLFTPYLYSKIRISHGRLLSENIYQSLELLTSTIRLEAQIGRRNEESIANLLALLPNLVSLSVHGSVAELLLAFSRFPEKKLLHLGQSLDDLSSRPSFSDLTLRAPINRNISCTGYYNDQEDPEILFRWPDLSIFHNLRKLQLFGLDGDIQQLGQFVASVLVASPNLKVLGLSMYLNSYFSKYGGVAGIYTPYPMLLKVIVDSLKLQRPDVAPHLDLDELILGLGALPVTNLATLEVCSPGDVDRLTSLSKLQILRLMNGDVGQKLDRGLSPSILKFVPETFYSCTSLKRLAVDVMGDDVVGLITHLRSLSSSLTELEVGRDEFSDQDHPAFGSSLKGAHWTKLHLGTVPLATAEFFKVGDKESLSDLEDLSLYFGRDARMKTSRIEPEQYAQWSFLLPELVTLPSLRRLRINWDQRLSTESTRRVAKALFVAHQEAMQLQNQRSRLDRISFCDNHTYTCNHSYACCFLPDWTAKPETIVGEREIVKLPDDEPSDWSWGSSYSAPEYVL